MKTTIARILLGILAITPLLTKAEPVQRQTVMKDAAWVLHIDADALRQTGFWKQFLTRMEESEQEQMFEAIKTKFHIDPRESLHGITLYGSSVEGEDGVALIHADIDADHLTSLAESAKDHESTKHGKTTIQSWSEGKRRIHGAIHGKTVVFGKDEDQVKLALDILEGSAPSLKGADAFPQFGSSKNHAVLQAEASMFKSGGKEIHAQVFKNAKHARLELMEVDGNLMVSLDLATNDSETAQKTTDLVRGIVALMGFQQDNPHASMLAQGVKVKQNKSNVKVTLTLSSKQIESLVNH